MTGLQRRRAGAGAILLAPLAAAAVLRAYPPATTLWYPACPIYQSLHVLCPGCGGTRAVAALLHGHVLEALRWNALVVLLLPFAICVFAQCWRRALSGRALVWPQVSPPILYALLALAAVFTVMRNMAGMPL